jgi:hypothetical protein
MVPPLDGDKCNAKSRKYNTGREKSFITGASVSLDAGGCLARIVPGGKGPDLNFPLVQRAFAARLIIFRTFAGDVKTVIING